MTNFPVEESVILHWNAGLIPLVSPSGGMSLILERRHLLITDPLLDRLVRLLQQPASLEALIRQTCPPSDPAEVRAAIAGLYAENVIVPARPQPMSRNLAAFWDTAFCPGPAQPVAVASLLPQFASPVESLLGANGVTVDPDAPLTVAITDDYLRPEMGQLAASHPLLLPAKPIGNELWIGPLLGPELCWECLAWWLKLRRWPEITITGPTPPQPVPPASVAWLPASTTAASGLIAMAATLWAAGQSPDSFAGHLWTFDLHTMKSQAYPVAPRRDCARCHTAADPARFLAALQSPKTGILDALRASDRPAGFLHLVNGSVLLPLPRPGVRHPAPPLAADGKGHTLPQALHRCTMEAVERYSCVFVGDEPLVHARLAEIDALPPAQLLHFSTAQFAARAEWNARPGTMHGVPEPLDPGQSIAWTKARSLADGHERYVPAGCTWLWYPFPGEPLYNFADTNGCAAGDTRAEATLRALLELIERDALAIWWYNRLPRPGVNLAQWPDPEVQSLCAAFTAHNRSLELLDLTHDLAIPTYAAVSASAVGDNVFFGCAADVCPARAAKRALAEVTQFWYWSAHGGLSPDRRIWLEKSSLDRHPYLAPAGEAPLPQERPLPAPEALAGCLTALQAGNIEAYVVDLTRPELDIPVVRVFAPQLRHYGPRFAPGRLYDVPVQMGWLPQPLSEEDMNPDSCIL